METEFEEASLGITDPHMVWNTPSRAPFDYSSGSEAEWFDSHSDAHTHIASSPSPPLTSEHPQATPAFNLLDGDNFNRVETASVPAVSVPAVDSILAHTVDLNPNTTSASAFPTADNDSYNNVETTVVPAVTVPPMTLSAALSSAPSATEDDFGDFETNLAPTVSVAAIEHTPAHNLDLNINAASPSALPAVDDDFGGFETTLVPAVAVAAGEPSPAQNLYLNTGVASSAALPGADDDFGDLASLVEPSVAAPTSKQSVEDDFGDFGGFSTQVETKETLSVILEWPDPAARRRKLTEHTTAILNSIFPHASNSTDSGEAFPSTFVGDLQSEKHGWNHLVSGLQTSNASRSLEFHWDSSLARKKTFIAMGIPMNLDEIHSSTSNLPDDEDDGDGTDSFVTPPSARSLSPNKEPSHKPAADSPWTAINSESGPDDDDVKRSSSLCQLSQDQLNDYSIQDLLALKQTLDAQIKRAGSYAQSIQAKRDSLSKEIKANNKLIEELVQNAQAAKAVKATVPTKLSIFSRK